MVEAADHLDRISGQHIDKIAVSTCHDVAGAVADENFGNNRFVASRVVAASFMAAASLPSFRLTSADAYRSRSAVSTVHTLKHVEHCKNTRVPLFLSKYCQWVSQLRLLWHCGHPTPVSQFGHPIQARLLGSASGSMGEWLTRSASRPTVEVSSMLTSISRFRPPSIGQVLIVNYVPPARFASQHSAAGRGLLVLGGADAALGLRGRQKPPPHQRRRTRSQLSALQARGIAPVGAAGRHAARLFWQWQAGRKRLQMGRIGRFGQVRRRLPGWPQPGLERQRGNLLRPVRT